MSQTIGVSTPYTINQDTTVASEDPPTFVFDYQIPVTFSSAALLATPDESLNALFSTRTYQQNEPEDPDPYTFVLTLDQAKLKTLLVASTWYGALTTGVDGCPTTGAASAGSAVLGSRLLEIIALKLFENAGARAAILNDAEYALEALLDGVIAGVAASVSTDRNMIFGQYVGLGRLSGGDVSAPTEFDFSNLKMTFPLYLDGSLPVTVTDALANKSGLGSDIVGGAYHIPISLLIDGTVVV